MKPKMKTEIPIWDKEARQQQEVQGKVSRKVAYCYVTSNGGLLSQPDEWQLSFPLAVARAHSLARERKALDFVQPEVCVGTMVCTKVVAGQLTSTGEPTVRFCVYRVDAWEADTGGWLPWERPEEDPHTVVFPDGTTVLYEDYQKGKRP